MRTEVRDKLATFRESFDGIAVEVIDFGAALLVACVPHPRGASDAVPPGNDCSCWVEVSQPFFMLIGLDRAEKRKPALRVVEN